MGKLIDLTGQKFGMLTVKYPIEHYTPTGNKITYWHCECECGNTCDTTSVSLRSGTKTSCGCLKILITFSNPIRYNSLFQCP